MQEQEPVILRNKATCRKNSWMIARIILTPIRALSKAKDLYIKGITNFSTTYSRPMMIMETTSTVQPLPRSFSATVLSNNDNHYQLPAGIIRANSTTAAGATEISVADLELYMLRQHPKPQVSRKVVPRSCSVGMGRIDEDRVSSFRDDNILPKNKFALNDRDSMLSRNLSYAHVSTNTR